MAAQQLGKDFVDMLAKDMHRNLLEQLYSLVCPADWSPGDEAQRQLVAESLLDTPDKVFCFNRLGLGFHPVFPISSYPKIKHSLRAAGATTKKYAHAHVHLQAMDGNVLAARRNSLEAVLRSLPPDFYFLNDAKARYQACEADLAETCLSNIFGYVVDGINMLLQARRSRLAVTIRAQHKTRGGRVTNDGDELRGSMDHCFILYDTAAGPESQEIPLVLVEEKPFLALRDVEWGTMVADGNVWVERGKRPPPLHQYDYATKIVPQVLKYVHESRCKHTMVTDGATSTVLEWTEVHWGEINKVHKCSFVHADANTASPYELILLLLVEAIHKNGQVEIYNQVRV